VDDGTNAGIANRYMHRRRMVGGWILVSLSLTHIHSPDVAMERIMDSTTTVAIEIPPS